MNTGKAVPKDELPWPEVAGRVFRMPRTHVEVDERSEVTPYGGIAKTLSHYLRIRLCNHSEVFSHEASRDLKLFLPDP